MIKQFNLTDKILILDFDHTCYDTDDFLLNEIRQPMLNRLNISIPVWEESYRKAANIGYSLERHLQEIIQIMKSVPCSLSEIQNFGKTINFSKYFYPDTALFLKAAREKGYKIMVLSFGAISWQNKKTLGSGIDKMVDLVEYVTTNGGEAKMEVIRQDAGNCNRIIFVDNKGDNLDAVHKALPKVKTYLMNRVPSDAMNFGNDEQTRIKYLESRRMAEAKTLFAHECCQSFKEIIL